MSKNGFTGVVAVFAVILTFLFLFVKNPVHNPTFGQAPSGERANVASSSTYTLAAATVTVLSATSTTCTNRTITTQAGYLELSFSDITGQSPGPIFGVYQAASTTVAYDSGQYGCGLLKAISNVAQAITLLEVR